MITNQPPYLWSYNLPIMSNPIQSNPYLRHPSPRSHAIGYCSLRCEGTSTCCTSELCSFAEAMEAAHHEELNKIKRKHKRKPRYYNDSLSFSASLPDDVHGVFADSICAVKYSINPFADLRESIVEMIREVGVRDWEEMEELVYCYVVLNPPEIHGFIGAAFLSLCSQDHEHVRLGKEMLAAASRKL